jgi:DNA-binding XRE family transcriptional regulator
MDYWHFTPQEKYELIRRLTVALPALRGAVRATQDEIANAIGVSRQTYSAVESQKKKMSWNTYMALILFFDYNPNSHYTIRQLDAFPHQLDECWLSGKVEQVGGE